MFDKVNEDEVCHKLLKKQLDQVKRHVPSDDLGYFIHLVDGAYAESDRERRITDRTMFTMEAEVMETNRDLLAQTKELKQTQERYLLAAEAANDGLWDWDLQTGLVYYSTRWSTMLDLPKDEKLSTIDDWLSRVHADDRAGIEEKIELHLAGKIDRIEVEYRIKHQRGDYITALARGLAARDEGGKATRIAGSQTDITIQKKYEQDLFNAAFYDELTGLANRSLFINRLEQSVTRVKRFSSHKACVLFLDLDRFKHINDTLGHDMGDEVLKVVATVLRNQSRATDTIARMGGDEFTLLLDPIESESEAHAIAQRILKNLNKPYEVKGREIHIASSIGLRIIDRQLCDAHSILRDADVAMYHAKNAGKSRLEIFDQAQHDLLMKRMEMEADLRAVAEREGFQVHYQPIIDLKTGRLSSFEALARWQHPTKGFISPAIFIPLAEEIGIIGAIGQSILEKVCTQIQEWIDTLGADLCPRVAVNISVRQFMDEYYFKVILDTLHHTKAINRFLVIEVTESVIMKDPVLIIERLHAIQDLGIAISIDDFGTGYSSLSYLHNFPFDNLKIDMEFISNMCFDPKAERLVSTIIGLAQDLDIKTVAEGLETREQLEKLCALGCSYGQGYYFSMARNAADATAILSERSLFFEPKGANSDSQICA